MSFDFDFFPYEARSMLWKSVHKVSVYDFILYRYYHRIPVGCSLPLCLCIATFGIYWLLYVIVIFTDISVFTMKWCRAVCLFLPKSQQSWKNTTRNCVNISESTETLQSRGSTTMHHNYMYTYMYMYMCTYHVLMRQWVCTVQCTCTINTVYIYIMF